MGVVSHRYKFALFFCENVVLIYILSCYVQSSWQEQKIAWAAGLFSLARKSDSTSLFNYWHASAIRFCRPHIDFNGRVWSENHTRVRIRHGLFFSHAKKKIANLNKAIGNLGFNLDTSPMQDISRRMNKAFVSLYTTVLQLSTGVVCITPRIGIWFHLMKSHHLDYEHVHLLHRRIIQ